MKKEKKGYDG